jgi:hypothetical protein
MVASNSRFSYSDCFELMDKAMADQKGIRIKFATREEAWHFRIRLHTARRIDRTDNMETYAIGHPMHGKSAYDPLTMRIRERSDGIWLRLEKVDAREFEVASLSDDDPQPELSFKTAPPPSRIVEKILEVRPLRRRI